jgi:chromate transporter
MIGLVKRQLIDAPSMIIALVTILVLLRFKKVQEPFVILAAALVGLVIKHWL